MKPRRPSSQAPTVTSSRTRRPAGRQRPPARRSRAPARRSPAFHAPSFSAGAVLGALLVLGAAYLPDLADTADAGTRDEPPGTPAARPKLTFEFDDLLRNSRVTADPEPYVSEPAPGQAGSEEEIVIQAASFRARADAERLRAALLLMDLPATTQPTTLDNGLWYRVNVGPYDSRVEADRALTRLREQDIAAISTTRPKR